MSRAVFWLVFGVVTLCTIPPSIYSAVAAFRNQRAAQRVLAIAETDRYLLDLAQTILAERGRTVQTLAEALVPPSAADRGSISALRQQSEADFANSVPRLRQLGLPKLAQDVEAAHADFAAVLTLADSALDLPTDNRDPALPDQVDRAAEIAFENLEAVCNRLNDLLRQDDPAMGTLIEIKQGLTTARRGFGSATVDMMVALSRGQVWSRTELAADSRVRGAAEQSWAIAKALANGQAHAPRLQAAIQRAVESHDAGLAAELRNSLLASMEAGIVPKLSVPAFVAAESPAIALIGKAALATDDDIVDHANELQRLSERSLAVRKVGLALAAMLFCGGLLMDRALQKRFRRNKAAQDEERLRLQEGERRLLTEREAAADAARQVVRCIGAGLERLAAGDLSYRLTTPLPDSYESLRSDLNSTFDGLETIVRHIASGTGSIREGIGRIAREADELNLRTEQQALRLETTASAMDDITKMTERTAVGAGNAAQIVAETQAQAEQSGEVVRRAIVAVAGIEQASERIGQIVRVIDGIATQTNLLALNAGIEAARAGDAGRGFAVVAGEVRQLAFRSIAAAKQIKELVSTAGQQVELGVRLVGETGHSFVRILEQVGGINEAVLTIAASAREQALGLTEVNDAISGLDRMTQQNACMVDQSTAASHELARETEALVRLTGRFRVENLLVAH